MYNFILSGETGGVNIQLIIWIFVAVCALGALIAALVVNKNKLKPVSKEEGNKEETEEEKVKKDSLKEKADIGQYAETETVDEAEDNYSETEE